jgi:hypothetical protein
MKRRIVVLAAAAGFGALASAMSGCAADEAQAREAEYPQPIGYTAIGSDAPGTPPPPPQQAPEGWTPGTNNGPPEGAPPPPDGVPNGPPPAPGAAPEGYASPPDGPANGPPPNGPPPNGPPPNGPPPNGGPPLSGPPGPDDGAGYSDADPSALTDFRSTLDPYGNWVDDPTYGTVWVPSPSVVGDDFTPYLSAGHWAYDDDYVWVSDYDWGWAPFHYGRWVYAGPMGWEWVPGRTYAGAWVAWRYGVGDWGYVGWAPLGPSWCWRGGLAVGVGFVPRAPYSFVGAHDLFAPAIRGRMVTGPQVGVVGSHTQPYVPASPRLGSSIGMRFAVGGPPLSTLGLSASAAVRVSATSNRGLAQAQAFSRPSTAVALGARGPQLGMPRPSASFRSTRLSGTIGTYGTSMYSARVPAYASSGPSHFGGRLGVGFAGSAASAPPPRPYYTSAPAYSGGPREVAPSYGRPSSQTSSGAYYRSYSAPSSGYAGSAYHTAPTPTPGPSGSSFHSSGGGGGASRSPGGRGGGRR